MIYEIKKIDIDHAFNSALEIIHSKIYFCNFMSIAR